MQKSDHHEQKLTSPRGLIHKILRRTNSRRSPTAADQQPSPVSPETSNSSIFSKQKDVDDAIKDSEKLSTHTIRIEDEKSDLLGSEIYSGKLTLDNKTKSSSNEQSGSGSSSNCFDARLSTEALIWGSNILKLEDIVSVSYNSGLRYFTVHACPLEKISSGLSCFMKPRRTQKDLKFVSSSPHEAFRWVNSFADQQCYVNLLPHPMASSKKHSSELIQFDAMFDPYVKCRSPPKILVILNPRSGHGRSSKVFHGKVEPIFKLAGFKMEVVKTTHAGHAKSLVSTIDFSTCPDGIVCVGGDGIVNEVLNGLLCRDDQNMSASVPIGIIPAGSDNSLIWTVLGVKDPISAALSIVRVKNTLVCFISTSSSVSLTLCSLIWYLHVTDS